MLLQMRQRENEGLVVFIQKVLSNKRDLVGIQIGSYRGQSAELFVKSGAFKTFYCIDPWEEGYDSSDVADSKYIHLAEQEFDLKFKNNDIVKKLKMKSLDAVKMFKDNSIDFVYIDGCHTYEAVKEDIKNYYPKLKYNSIIGGHDWGWQTVRKAVLNFFHQQPKIISPDSSWFYFKDVISIN